MLDIHIKLDREEVIACEAYLGEGEVLPDGYSKEKLLIALAESLLGGFTLEGVLRDVRLYLIDLEVPLGKYQVTLTQYFGGSRKTLTYESGRP